MINTGIHLHTTHNWKVILHNKDFTSVIEACLFERIVLNYSSLYETKYHFACYRDNRKSINIGHFKNDVYYEHDQRSNKGRTSKKVVVVVKGAHETRKIWNKWSIEYMIKMLQIYMLWLVLTYCK